jgi:hypothetical protein
MKPGGRTVDGPGSERRSMMDLAFLQELKTRLINEADFKKVWEAFFDWMDANLEFMDLGKPVSDRQIEATVAHVVAQMLPGERSAVMLRLIRLADQKFVHGAVNVGRRAGGLIYFEDVNVGLLAVSEQPPSDETKFARFSTMPYKPRRKPSRN